MNRPDNSSLSARPSVAAAPAGRRRNRKYVAGMIVFGGLLGPVFLMLAIKRAPAASVAIWLNMELIATALLGWLLFKDHLHVRGWLSVVITLAAGLLLSWDGGAALLVGFVSYGLSITLYIAAAQKLGAVRSQLAFSAAPIFGVLLSVLFLGEGLSAVQLISGVLLFGSVLLMMSEKHAHAHLHAAMDHSHSHTHDDLHHGHSHDGPPSGPHAHFHRHDPDEHEHPHWPDLHHRHGH
ncbi:MAG: putative permease of the drug/metabolite transporter (DMT) superfamily [Elusimicrobia bacterium]|nr:MAG: putative permease of the drug/metabolite transporter (DMT) superfamily [Elusimicrobiota bacterium]KAF0153897.1 MAG: putative permease of the drug/metabolite transporter (DMT) superfamily [Elusimicrobiota bacterium]